MGARMELQPKLQQTVGTHDLDPVDGKSICLDAVATPPRRTCALVPDALDCVAHLAVEVAVGVGEMLDRLPYPLSDEVAKVPAE